MLDKPKKTFSRSELIECIPRAFKLKLIKKKYTHMVVLGDNKIDQSIFEIKHKNSDQRLECAYIYDREMRDIHYTQ